MTIIKKENVPLVIRAELKKQFGDTMPTDMQLGEFWMNLNMNYKVTLGKTTFNKATSQVEFVPTDFYTAFNPDAGKAHDIFLKTLDLSVFKTVNPFHHNPDERKYLECCKKLFANTNAYSAGATATTFSRFIENLYESLGDTEARHNQMALYLYSEEGGTGKSTLGYSLLKTLRDAQVKATSLNLNPKWLGDEFNKNNMVYVDEYRASNRFDEDLEIVGLHNIIDNVEYNMTYKGMQSVSVKARCAMMMSSNKLPPETDNGNDRRFGIIKFNNNKDYYLDEEAKEYAPAVSYSRDYSKALYDDKLIIDAIESCPFHKTWKDQTKTVKTNIDNLIYRVREVRTYIECNSINEDLNKMTPHKLAELYMDAHEEQRTGRRAREFMDEIVIALSQSKTKPVKNIKNTPKWSFYNFNAIADMTTNEEDETTCVLDSISNPYEQTAKAFDMLMPPETPTDPEPTKKENKSVIEPLDETAANFHFENTPDENMFTFKTNTSNCSVTPQADDSYIALCEPTEEYTELRESTEPLIIRQNCDTLPTAFVYESDDLSLEQQKKLADKALASQYKENIMWVTSSGHKSLHIVVKIRPEDRKFVADDYKFWWEAVGQRIFGSWIEDMDKACSTRTRLCRNPNGIREDGNKQVCYYAPKTKAVGFDLSLLESEYKFHQNELAAIAFKAREAVEKAKDKDYSGRSEEEQLRDMYNKNPAKWQLAYNTLIDGLPIPAGTDMYKTINMLKKAEKPGLAAEFQRLSHEQHPSNIPSAF